MKILAFQGPNEVFANKYGLGFPQPGASTESMQLFFGGVANPDSVTTWSIADTSKPGTKANGTTIDSGSTQHPGVSFMFIFDSCTSFEWINCDHFIGDGYTLTQVTVQLPDNTYNSSNTQVFIIFPTDKSVARAYNYSASKNTFTTQTHAMPVGLNYEIVVTTNKNGSYYYWEGAGTVTENMTVSAAMASETLQDIIDRMHAL